MRPALILAAALVAALLSGCTDGDAGTDDADRSTLAGDREEAFSAGGEPVPEPEPVAADEAESHGEVERTESPVETEMQQDGSWRAWYNVTLENGVAGFSEARVSFKASAGSIDAIGESAGSYLVVATVEARGLTEQAARDELARHTVVHTDTDEDGVLVLDTHLESEAAVTVPPVPPVLPDGITINPATATFSIAAWLPSHLFYGLDFDASSGSISAAGLRGGDMAFDVSSGSISLAELAGCDVSADASSGGITIADTVACTLSAGASSGSVSIAESRAATLEVDTSSGNVDVEGVFDNADLDASSGSISATLTPESSGVYVFDTSSGGIDVVLGKGGGRAYDVEASVTSGTVTVELTDGEIVEADEDGSFVHARTRGYDDADIQTLIEADASSGSITIVG